MGCAGGMVGGDGVGDGIGGGHGCLAMADGVHGCWVLAELPQGAGRTGPRSWPNWPKELAGLTELNGEGGGGRGRMNYETRGTGTPKQAYKPIHIFPMRLPELSQQTGTELGPKK